MNIPAKIKIGGYDIDVVLCDRVESDGAECFGQCDIANYEIKLCKNVNDDRLLSTFIHECIEAINFIYGIGLPHNKIVALESGVFQVIKGLTI